MNEDEKKQIAFRMCTRVLSGFQFIEDKYLVPQNNAGGPDTGWLRNIYILFSFYLELLLKSAIVLSKSLANANELNDKLKKLGHNFIAIGDELKNTGLEELGINSITLKNDEYKIETSKKAIFVKNFNDIRCDFIQGKVRNITTNEDLIIQESLDGAYEILFLLFVPIKKLIFKFIWKKLKTKQLLSIKKCLAESYQ